MSEGPHFLVECGGPVPASELIAVLGQLYVAILLVLIICFAGSDANGLINAEGVLEIGDPAIMSSFTA